MGFETTTPPRLWGWRCFGGISCFSHSFLPPAQSTPETVEDLLHKVCRRKLLCQCRDDLYLVLFLSLRGHPSGSPGEADTASTAPHWPGCGEFISFFCPSSGPPGHAQVSPAQSRVPYCGQCRGAAPLTALLVVLVFTKVTGFIRLKKLVTAPQTACLLL